MALPESQASLHCQTKAMLYDIEMTLGKRIKAARERLRPKPTQSDIAEHFGVTDKAVSSWERDETIPDVDKIAELSRVLKVPVLWLLEGKGSPPAVGETDDPLQNVTAAERAIMLATLHALRKSHAA
jgi:transcriptional regulator with XRE-family HTH domain